MSYTQNTSEDGIQMNGLDSVRLKMPDKDVAENAKEKKDEEEDSIEPCGGAIGKSFGRYRWLVADKLRERSKFCRKVVRTLTSILIAVYVGAVCYKYATSGDAALDWCRGYGMALMLFVLTLWFMTYYKFLRPFFVAHSPIFDFERYIDRKNLHLISFFAESTLMCSLLIALISFAIIDTSSNRRRLVSLGGWFTFILFGFICSKHPEYIRWRTVIRGIALQMCIGILTIKWTPGRIVFECAGNIVETFLAYGYKGASFIYGDLLVERENVFAFRGLSVMYFVAMVVEIMFYLGWLQVLCFKVGGVMQKIMGTTIIESVNAVTTVFLGMNEVPFVYKTYIPCLTRSEIHAIIAACFAAVSGSMMAAYTSAGIDASFIVTASSMAAPAALGYAKLFYPENKRSKTTSDNIVLHKSEASSIMDAACKGAYSAVEIVMGIISNMIACISIIAFVNGMLSWLGFLIGADHLTFEFILGKVFIPIAYMMGVEPSQCEDVARLIGLKTTINEFYAYKELGVLKSKNILSRRSEAIATFALCGFANPGSISIMISTLSGFAPAQRENIIYVIFRSFVSASCTSFMSACIVGLLMPEEGFQY